MHINNYRINYRYHMDMTTKMNKEVYIHLILELQRNYKLTESRATTLLLFDENMLTQQLATILDTIDKKSPNSLSSEGIGDFGVTSNNKYTVNSVNKNQLVLAALNKLDKKNLVDFTFKVIQQNSHQKNAAKNKFHRSNSVHL